MDSLFRFSLLYNVHIVLKHTFHVRQIYATKSLNLPIFTLETARQQNGSALNEYKNVAVNSVVASAAVTGQVVCCTRGYLT